MTQDDLREALWSMPLSERSAMLVLSILQDEKNDPVTATKNIVRVTGFIAEYLNETDRFLVSEKMRDVADALEHRQEVVG